MSRRAQENILALVLLGVFVAIAIMSFDYSPRARLVPLPIALTCIVLICIQLFWQNKRQADDLEIDVLDLVSGGSERAAELEAEAKRQARQETAPAPARNWRERFAKSEFGALAVLATLIAMFVIIGPIPAVFVFSLGYFYLSGHSSAARSLAYATACAASLYVMFAWALQVDLNQGLIAPLMTKLSIAMGF